MDKNGRSPLDYAADNKKSQIYLYLTENVVDPQNIIKIEKKFTELF